MKKLLPFILLFVSLTIYSQEIELDTDYGIDGYTISTSQETDDIVKSILLDDGSLLMTFFRYNEATLNNHESILIKYTESGLIDTDFASNGIYTSDIKDDNGIEIFTDINGYIYLAGYDYVLDKNIITKVSPEGVLDDSFGNNGKVEIDNTYINVKYYFKNNYLYVSVNYVGDSGSSDEYGIKRLDLNGNFDISFGNEGIIDINTSSIVEFYVTNSDDFIILGSDQNSDNAIISKYKNNGDIDEAFGNNGVLFTKTEPEYDLNLNFHEIESTLYMSISSDSTNDSFSEIYKLNTNTGALDTNFNQQEKITINDFFVTDLDIDNNNLYLLGIEVNSLSLQLNSYDSENGLINENFADEGVFFNQTDFVQFTTDFHIKGNSFIITGENNFSDTNVEYFSSKYDLTNSTASVSDFEATNISFQNPVEDFLEVNSINNIEKLEIYSLGGRLLKSAESNTISVQELSQNIYVLNCYTENGNVISKKIIKQ